MTKKSNITIIGSGLVGSLWGVLLQNRGHQVTIYEKRSDIRLLQEGSAEKSINLILTSRGLNGLNLAGLLNEAIAISVPVLGRMIHSRSGETQYQAYGNEDECNFSISRSGLNKFLLTAAEKSGAKIYFNHELSHIDFHKKEIKFNSDKISENYHLLFGCDGAGSIVRRQLSQQMPEVYKDHIDWLEADYKELFMPKSSDNNYPIKKNALHIWPRGGHMMMGLADLDGSFTMTMYMPKIPTANNTPNYSQITSSEDVKNLFESDFKDAIGLMPDYVNDFLIHPQGKLGTLNCTKWVFEDSIVLLGDAAHAMVPFFGQGTNCGFEDCINFLKILDDSNENWPHTITQFEKYQRPNALAISEMALENWTEMRDKVGDEKFLLRKKVEAILEGKFPNLYKSRYGMVTYTMIPYAITQKLGKLQNNLLDEVCLSLNSIDEIDLGLVEKLLVEKLSGFILEHKLSFQTDALVAKMKKEFT
jgi:kynurenine 3-monooxygenase